MFRLVALAGALSVACSFSYDRCASDGPSGWGGYCSSGKVQTPINLCGGTLLSNAPSITLGGYDSMRPLKLWNTGHSIQADIVNSPPILTAGPISSLVGHSSNSSTATWALAQVHVHFGRTNKVEEGSEHYMQNINYPLEAHLVHYNLANGGSLSAAVASGKSDSLLVVGVMFNLGGGDVPLIANMAEAAKKATQTPTTMSTTFQISDVLPSSILDKYYTYAGSLTTPPCAEMVTWIVMQTPLSVTFETLKRFKEASENPSSTSHKFHGLASGETMGKFGTFRPLQSVAGRAVYTTTNYGTGPCRVPGLPSYDCPRESGARAVTIPSSLILSMLIALASLSRS